MGILKVKFKCKQADDSWKVLSSLLFGGNVWLLLYTRLRNANNCKKIVEMKGQFLLPCQLLELSLICELSNELKRDS